jgi:pyruvate dehydrogenase E2 component (dihydrolipoamide acetyltransferase)
MYEVTMPQAGNTMEDGTIVRWLKREGEAVREGESLLEIETDKANIEVESAHGGTLLKVLCPEGRTVPVHAVIAVIGEPGEDVSAAVAKAQAHAPADADAPAEPAPPAAAEADPAPKPQAGRDEPAVPPAQTPPAGGKVIPVLMPQAGNTMEEGTIVSWRVGPGDEISEGQVIFEVETDKATIEVEATDAGRLARIVVGEGETIEVLKPVAYLADSDADVEAYLGAAGGEAAAKPAAAPKSAPAAPQAVPAASADGGPPAPPTPGATRVKASPAARKLARQRGIDLSAIGAGSGPGGRIVTADVPAAAATAAAPAATPPAKPRRTPMSSMRKAIARNLLASKQTIPHFYLRMTIDADPLMAFYRAEKAKYDCTINDVIVMACARVLREFPAVRSHIEGDELVEVPGANVGIAVGVEAGLVVPVVVAAETLTLRQLAQASRRVVEAARGGKIEGLGKGCFTVTNLGMYGIEEFAAIINPPETAILAVGAVREAVVVRDGAMRPGRVMTLTLSADHRVVDGVVGATFLNRLKEVLTAPPASA